MSHAELVHDIELMERQLVSFGHRVDRDRLCLNINGIHLHQSTWGHLHAFLSGYLAAAEQYEWREAKAAPTRVIKVDGEMKESEI